MLTIRLTRVGKKKQPLYRLIVCEKARDPWGKNLEIVGTYNPHTKPATLNIEKERVAYWLSKGAQCSDTVNNLFIEEKLISGEKTKLSHITKRHKERLEKAKQA